MIGLYQWMYLAGVILSGASLFSIIAILAGTTEPGAAFKPKQAALYITGLLILSALFAWMAGVGYDGIEVKG